MELDRAACALALASAKLHTLSQDQPSCKDLYANSDKWFRQCKPKFEDSKLDIWWICLQMNLKGDKISLSSISCEREGMSCQICMLSSLHLWLSLSLSTGLSQIGLSLVSVVWGAGVKRVCVIDLWGPRGMILTYLIWNQFNLFAMVFLNHYLKTKPTITSFVFWIFMENHDKLINSTSWNVESEKVKCSDWGEREGGRFLQANVPRHAAGETLPFITLQFNILFINNQYVQLLDCTYCGTKQARLFQVLCDHQCLED